MSVLPACKKCNNGFSDDELYTEVHIDTLKYLSGYSSSISSENESRIYKCTAFMDAQSDLKEYYETNVMKSNAKILRVISKLALCHMVYELSEGYSYDGCFNIPNSVSYKFSFEMTAEQKKAFDDFVYMNDKQLPVIGSRVFDKIYMIEPVVKNDSISKKVPLAFMNWTDVQEGNYLYVAWLDDDIFRVKIIIYDFLFAEISFKQNSN